jgi:hypothetical protein
MDGEAIPNKPLWNTTSGVLKLYDTWKLNLQWLKGCSLEYKVEILMDLFTELDLTITSQSKYEKLSPRLKGLFKKTNE